MPSVSRTVVKRGELNIIIPKLVILAVRGEIIDLSIKTGILGVGERETSILEDKLQLPRALARTRHALEEGASHRKEDRGGSWGSSPTS